MLRTILAFGIGAILGFVILGSLVSATVSLPPNIRTVVYYAGAGTTGLIVGFLVKILRAYKPSLVAVGCLMPAVFLQYVNPVSHGAHGLRLILLLLGSVAELWIAFIVASERNVVGGRTCRAS